MHDHRRMRSHGSTVPLDARPRIPAEHAEPVTPGPWRRYRRRVRYVHYCVPCDAWSPERSDSYQATADRDEHRHRDHHPLTPRDRIEEIPGPLDIAASALLSGLGRAARTGVRRAAKSKALRQIRGSDYWQQAVRMLAIGVGILVLGAVILRHLG